MFKDTTLIGDKDLAYEIYLVIYTKRYLTHKSCIYLILIVEFLTITFFLPRFVYFDLLCHLLECFTFIIIFEDIN